MSTAVPPPPPPVSGASAAPVSTPVATVSSPPPALLKLDIGAAFFATITSGKIPGQPQTAESPFGQLALKLNQTLPQNAQVGFKVQSLVPQPQLLVTSVNGKPTVGQHATPQQTAALTGAPTPAAGATATAASVTVGSGNLIVATVLTPGAAQWARGMAGPQHGTTSLPANPGTTAQGQTSGLSTSGPGAQSTPASGSATSSASPPPSLGQGTSSTGSTPSIGPGAQEAIKALMAGSKPNLPAGMQLEVKIAPEAPQTPTSGSQAGRAPGIPTSTPVNTTLSGTVTGTTPQGQPIIQTPSGYLALDTKTPLETGAKISLEIPAHQTALKTPAPIPGLSHEGARPWPNLTEAMSLLKDAAPAVADQVASGAIPKPDAGMGNSVVFFLAALRLGTVRNWLGEAAMRVIERERPGLIPRLADDLKKSSKPAGDQTSGDWRVTMVPVDTGQSIQQIAMCLRDSGGEEENANGGSGTGTRFIIDLELTKYGRMQLDGLAKQADHKLDLAIRSATPLPPDMRKDINALFTRSTEALGLTGQLVFLGTANFVEIEGIDVTKDTLGMIV